MSTESDDQSDEDAPAEESVPDLEGQTVFKGDFEEEDDDG